jgi:phosphatidylserine/phosphatidylglycerophosphate/cardiolipin synthase-like enzyme
MSSRSIIILPDDTKKPFVDALHAATKTIRIKMFSFSDPDCIRALVEAQQRGVLVQVMLNPARRNGETENEPTREKLVAEGIEVKDSNPAFGLTHEKSMVIDERLAFVQSLNWTEKNFTVTRDYAVMTSYAHEVTEILACFRADWERTAFDAGDAAHLIWCKGNGRDRIARFIDSARHALFVENERLQDPVIIERLVRAALRGVKVHLMVRSAHTLKKEKLLEAVGGLRILEDVGVRIHTLHHLKLHGKLLLADHSRAIVGSINLAPGSFDDRRELAIETNDPDIITRLRWFAHKDWENSHPLDLTDEGLVTDLNDRGEGGCERLALGSS